MNGTPPMKPKMHSNSQVINLKISFLACLPLAIGLVVASSAQPQNSSLGQESRSSSPAPSKSLRLVMLADAHVPDGDMAGKRSVVSTINTWPHVDAVVALGDLVASRGTASEYAAAKSYFSMFTKPVYYLTGNHDYIYSDHSDRNGGNRRATMTERMDKLSLFKATFNASNLYFSKQFGNVLLVFASADSLDSRTSVTMSSRQLNWLSKTLSENKNLNTIVFYHAPLFGTADKPSLSSNSWAQPINKIDEILNKNPQVKAWIAGHAHICPEDNSFISPINSYKNRVLTIHNCDYRDRKRFWTSELIISDHQLQVNTYDHSKRRWEPRLTRILKLGNDP
jgi:3',5'-cyclic-AMP phosphodiesterase